MAVEKKVEDLLVGDTIELHGVQWRVFFKRYLPNHKDCQIKLHGAPLQDIGIEERPELNVVASRTTMWTLYEPPSVFDETRPKVSLSPCAMSGCANKSDLDNMFCSSCRWVSSSTTFLKVGDTFKYKNNARFPLIHVIFRAVKPEIGQGIGLRAIGVERAAYPHFIDPEVEILIPRSPLSADAVEPKLAWVPMQARALKVGDTLKYRDGTSEHNKGLVFEIRSTGVSMLAFEVVDQHGKTHDHKMHSEFEVLANRPVAPESKDENALATREQVVAEIQDAAEKLASVFESTWGSMTISQRDARYIANAVLSKADLRLKKIK